jgi:effector-binding domain-containing protein
VTDFEIIDLPEQATVVRRARVPAADLRSFFDETYPRLFAAAAAQGVTVAGPPFAMYHGMPGEVIDLEIGFPVQGRFEPQDDLAPSVLPACRAVVGEHVGPYEQLAQSWMAMQAWGAEHGARRAGDAFWEQYVSDPGAEPDPQHWRTRLVQPVE